MKNDNAYIVIAQTHDYVLESIRKQRDPNSKNHVIYTTNPGDVLAEALINPVDIVVTGQLFYKSDLTSLEDMINALYKVSFIGYQALVKHYQPPKSGPYTGSALSKEVYSINPKILVFRYSLAPEERGRIVGDINKFRSDQDLIELIDSPELPDILRTKDWERLEKTLPKIKFYEGWKEEH